MDDDGREILRVADWLDAGTRLSKESLHGVLAGTLRVLRRRDPRLARQLADLVNALVGNDMSAALPLIAGEAGPVLLPADAAAQIRRDSIGAFERTARRRGPRTKPDLTPVAHVEGVEWAFRRMLSRNRKPTRKTWLLVCRRLWRTDLRQRRALPDWVVDAVIVGGRSARSRALVFVSTALDVELDTLRRRVDRAQSR
jgi:hypothetical protein